MGMIDLVWNFPLFAEQGAEWQGYLRRAVEELPVEMRGCCGLRFGRRCGAARAGGEVAGGGAGAGVDCVRRASWNAGVAAGGGVGWEDGCGGGDYVYGDSGAGDDARDARLVACAFDGEGMRPEALREVCEREKVAGVFLMPTVHNPLGIVAGLERR